MNEVSFATIFKFGGAALAGGGVGWAVYTNATGTTLLTRCYATYAGYLTRQMSLLFLSGSSHFIIASQGVLTLVLIGCGIWADIAAGYPLAILAALAPAVYLHGARRSHVRKLENQVDSLITGLANALRSVPNPAAAMNQVVTVMPAPMRFEVDRALRELRFGNTLEQSLLNMSRRVGSPNLDAALSALLIGLQVGGNLPEVLETTAATIREMERLEGVIKAKTAEGRAQLWVLTALPCSLCIAFRYVDPDYFTPMTSSVVGTIAAAIAGLFWLGALPIAYRILKVNI